MHVPRTVNDAMQPYYAAVAVEHGYLRATANCTAMRMQVCCRALSLDAPAGLCSHGLLRYYTVFGKRLGFSLKSTLRSSRSSTATCVRPPTGPPCACRYCRALLMLCS